MFGYSLRKQVQKKTLEIKKSEAIYQNVFNAVDEGLIILDKSEIIIEANHKAYDLFNYKNNHLIGTHILGLVREENKEKVEGLYDLIREGKPFYKDSLEREINGRQQYISLKGFKTDLEEQQRYLIVIHDITEERKNLVELQQAKKNVEIANNAKSTFLSTISHEIRTPLFAVIGYTRLLNKTSLTKEQSDYNKKIELSGKLLLNLVNDILDLTKMEAEKLKLNLKPFDVRHLIKEICELESIKAAEKSIALIYDIDEKVPDFLIGDKLLISRIILNIVNNAIKFTDKGIVRVMVNVENLEQAIETGPLNIVFQLKIRVLE
ncbi:MAG: PAS domain S-box protein [Chloroflexia bacterium]|nr:PAS domain S-box protein [Chloroflexia bacterium]